MRGIAAALHDSARRRVKEDRHGRSSGELSLPSAPMGRTAAAQVERRSDVRRRRQASRQAARSTTRSPSVLSLARARPALLALPPAVVPPPAAAVDFVAGGEPFSISEGCETRRDGEGPPSVESALLRRRGDTNPSGGWCSPAGRSFLLAAAAVGLVVLLALLVLCVVVANRELAALGGRIAELEGPMFEFYNKAAGGQSAHPEDAAAADFGFRRCSECVTGFFV